MTSFREELKSFRSTKYIDRLNGKIQPTKQENSDAFWRWIKENGTTAFVSKKTPSNSSYTKNSEKWWKFDKMAKEKIVFKVLLQYFLKKSKKRKISKKNQRKRKKIKEKFPFLNHFFKKKAKMSEFLKSPLSQNIGDTSACFDRKKFFRKKKEFREASLKKCTEDLGEKRGPYTLTIAVGWKNELKSNHSCASYAGHADHIFMYKQTYEQGCLGLLGRGTFVYSGIAGRERGSVYVYVMRRRNDG